MKENRDSNKDKIILHKKDYYKNNKEKINKYNTEYRKNKRNNNPIFRLKENIRIRIRESLQFNNKATNTINLLGCNKELFYHFIKFQMPYDMSDMNLENITKLIIVGL